MPGIFYGGKMYTHFDLKEEEKIKNDLAHFSNFQPNHRDPLKNEEKLYSKY